MPMTLVGSVTVGAGGASSLEFSNIPATGKDLVVLGSIRCSSWGVNLTLELNGSASNFSSKGLLYNGTSVAAYGSPSNWVGVVNGTNRATNVFSNIRIDIANYATTQNKGIQANNAYADFQTAAYPSFHNLVWSNSATINSIKLVPEDKTWLEGTILSVYTIS